MPGIIYIAYGEEHGDFRWMGGVYLMREFCWAYPLNQKLRIFLDATMSQMGFLGNGCLLYMLFRMPNIADLFHEDRPPTITGDDSKEKRKKATPTLANGPSSDGPRKKPFKETKKI